MIDFLKKIWKVEGMDYKDNPANSSGAFKLIYENQTIGHLEYSKGIWKFYYDNEYIIDSNKQPIVDFPDKEKKYTAETLWPFFATRIPTLNQSYQYKKIKKANIEQNDSVGLLKLFGNKTINNPFLLVSN